MFVDRHRHETKKRYAILTMLAAMAIGCSSDSELPSVDVSGKVLMNGEPFSGVAVRFYNSEYGGGAFNLDEEGNFSSAAPLKVGEYLVSLDKPGPEPGDNPAEMDWPEDRSGDVPKEYRSGTRSGLVAQLQVDGENHFVFELTGNLSKGGKKEEGPQVIQPINQ